MRDPDRPQRREQEVLDAAARVFQAKGIAGATVEDIANELGILKGSLYHYVRSKDELLYRVIRGALLDSADRLEAIVRGEEPPLARVRDAIRAHIEVFHTTYPYMSVALQEHIGRGLPREQAREIQAVMARHESLWLELLQEAQAAGPVRADLDARLAVFGILGMCNWLYRWYNPEGRMPAAAIADQFATIVLHGIAETDTGQPPNPQS